MQHGSNNTHDDELSRLVHQNRQLQEEILVREKREALILHAKKEWERTVDALPDLIFIVNLEYKFVRMNKTMLNRLGLTFQEALGRHCFFCVHGRENTVENCLQIQVLRDKQQHSIELYEPRLGGHFELSVVPHYDAEGKLAGSVHIARDINERKHAEQEQEILHARLLQAQKLESVGQLAAGIAHEINTPAQFINTNIDFIDEAFRESSQLITSLIELLASIKKGPVSEEQISANNTLVEHIDWSYLKEEIPRAINQSKEGIQRVTSIIQAMKEFSHPGSRQKVNTDLNRIINTTITVAKNEWKYVATVDTDLDPEVQSVPCLADEMGQVFLNLLINAAHAIENKLGKNPEGKKGRITLSTRQHDHYVEIRITDTGSGIPENIQNKVFDPFFTTKEVGKGTGQGLAIAHDVIAGKHGGTLVFETEPGIGTTFIIRLPRSNIDTPL
jgi:two-component system, NtrC family, sensor kinase